jgi:ribonuclease BN (tRNA processing enzyme)
VSEIVFVGTSDAFGAGGRRQSAVLVRGPSGTVLLDCGVTTNTGLGALDIERGEIDAILISHFHGDHFGGIPLLLLAAQYNDARRNPLRIVGPPGTEVRVRALAEAMGHPLSENDFDFEILFDELRTDRLSEVGPVKARSFSTHHQPHTQPHGIVVETGSDRISYSGDTGWFDELPAQVAGSALFVCECTFWTPRYEFHLDHQTLVERRARFDCGRWILTHLGADMNEARSRSEFETADDGLVVHV